MERYPIGNVYEGQFVADKREGIGTMWYPGGDTYEGFYKAGKKEGRGKYRSASGALYEGEYKADLREGQGKERYPDGSVYEGGSSRASALGWARCATRAATSTLDRGSETCATARGPSSMREALDMRASTKAA